MRKTLSVCLVVRNEARQIVDCMESIKVVADEIVVVDTGSADNTVGLVTEWGRRNGALSAMKILPVGNRFHDSDGDFDFGAAKTFAFQNATKDYVMWIDATDRISDQIMLKRRFIEVTFAKDVIITIPTRTPSGHAFNRLRIAQRDKSTMVGRIHEYMWVSDITGLSRIHINVPIDNDKSTRDLSRNLRLLKKEFDREPSARNAFYLGNTCFGMRKYDEAIEWFRKRVYSYEWADEYAEEYYKSLECIADSTLKLIASNTSSGTISLSDVFDISNEMIRREPTRVEGYYYLGLYHMERKQFDKAIESFRNYTTCRIPKDVKLWLDPNIYGGKAVIRMIERCRLEQQLDKPLIPDAILDYGPSVGDRSYQQGSSQYEVGGGKTVF